MIAGVFMINLLCAIVPCDPNFRQPEISHQPADLQQSVVVQQEGRLLKRFLDQGTSAPKDVNPIVLVKNGALQGQTLISAGGHKYKSFQGIPYGESPTGPLRWKSPVPKKPWKGIIRAIKPGPDCLQHSPAKAFRVYGNEDCLYLNIATPQLPNDEDSPLNYPVIIFLHGGSFYYGSGAEYGGAYLLDEKIVYVSINYRLGILGFMSVGDSNASGNFGLKDQALAIKWVSENIEKFGGNPNKILLTGHSAGAGSVHLHMMSKKSRPYFHAAVSMSGSAFNNFALKDNKKIRKYTERVARKFHCLNESVPFEKQTASIVHCLKRRDPVKLVYAQRDLQAWGPFPITIFAPTIESPDDPDAYIVQTAKEAYANGNVAKIPWMATVTEDEGLYALLAVYGYFLMPTLRSNFTNLAPYILEYEDLDPHAASVTTKKIENFYFPHNSISDVSYSQLSQPFSDRIFVNDIYDAIQAHAKIAPTYSYLFRYKGKYNVGNFIGLSTQEWGSGHAEDVFFLFNSSTLYHGFQTADPERKLSQVMVNLFANFAAEKEPLFTKKETGEVLKIWDPVDPDNVQFLQLDTDIKMIDNFFSKRIEFWKTLKLPS